jgi:hypothetical protein
MARSKQRLWKFKSFFSCKSYCAGRGASPGAPGPGHDVQRHQGLGQASRLPSGPHLVWFALTTLLLPPTLTHAHEHGKAPLEPTGLIPQRRNDFGAPSFLGAGLFRSGRRAHLRALAHRDLTMVQTRLRSVLSTPTRFRPGGRILGPQGLPAARACRKRGRLPPGGHTGCARGPGLRWDFVAPLRPRMEPAPPLPRPRPQSLHRLDQARDAVWREGDRRLASPPAQSPPDLLTTGIALPRGGRAGAPDLPPLYTEAPDTPHAGLPPPTASRLIHRLATPRGEVRATEGAGPQRCIRVGEAIRDSADGTLGAPNLAERLLPSALHVAWGHPTRLPLDDERGQPSAGAAHGCSPLRALPFPAPSALGERQAQAPFRRLHGPLVIAMAISLWGLLPFVAAPAERLGLLLLECCLEDPCGRETSQGPQSFCSTVRVTLAIQHLGQHLRLSGPWR